MDIGWLKWEMIVNLKLLNDEWLNDEWRMNDDYWNWMMIYDIWYMIWWYDDWWYDDLKFIFKRIMLGGTNYKQ